MTRLRAVNTIAGSVIGDDRDSGKRMTCLYFDCFSGASGDMIVGALIDLGVNLDDLRCELSKLHLDGYSLDARTVNKSSISGTKFDVQVAGHSHNDHEHDHSHSHDHHHEHDHGHSHEHKHAEEHSDSHNHEHRSLSTIEKMIADSDLAPRVKERATRIFCRLGEAEAAVHNIPIEDVHFHEVGAVDSIIDIVGACVGFEMLGIERFFSSSLNVGYGTVKCAHGILPVPAPLPRDCLRVPLSIRVRATKVKWLRRPGLR